MTFKLVIRDLVHLYDVVCYLNQWHDRTHNIWRLTGNMSSFKTQDMMMDCTVSLISCKEGEEVEDDGLSVLVALL